MLSNSPFILSFLLLFSLPLLFVLAPRILPPKTLPSIPDPDEIDDLALFRRATLASAGGGATAGLQRRPASPPKIAFLFLTNSDLSFAPLWERFFAGHGRLMNVYVHADPAARLDLPPTPSFRGRFIPAKATQRASSTLISAARRLFAAALLDDPANAFFALISQHCIPLHSFQFIYHALLADPGTSSLSFGGRLGRRHHSFIQILTLTPAPPQIPRTAPSPSSSERRHPCPPPPSALKVLRLQTPSRPSSRSSALVLEHPRPRPAPHRPAPSPRPPPPSVLPRPHVFALRRSLTAEQERPLPSILSLQCLLTAEQPSHPTAPFPVMTPMKPSSSGSPPTAVSSSKRPVDGPTPCGRILLKHSLCR